MANTTNYRKFLTRNLIPATMSTATLWEHQRIMLEFAANKPQSLLYAGMSTGKTLVALRYLEAFKGLRLIICPAAPMGVYQEDYDKFYTDVKPFELYTLDSSYGSSQDKLKFIEDLVDRNANAIVVLSYSSASLMDLSGIPFTALVGDEVHRIGVHNSVQSISLAKSCAHIKFKMVMSGTPYFDDYSRLYGVYRLLDPILFRGKKPYPQAKLFGHYDNFLNCFAVTYQLGNTRIVKSYKNIDRLYSMIESTCLQINTEDVIDLPELVLRRYSTSLPKKTRAAYDDLSKDAIITFDDSDVVLAPHVLTRILRLQQLISSGELISEDGQVKEFNIEPRLNKLQLILEELANEPVIIFTKFKKDVVLISRLIHKVNPNAGIAYLTGDLDTHEQWKSNTPDAPQYLICNISSGSEGVRLTRACHLIVWSCDYSLKSYSQMIARTRRYGQQSKRVFIHLISSENTVDEQIYAALERKMRDVESLDQFFKEGM